MSDNKYTDDRFIEDGSAVKKKVENEFTPVHYHPKKVKDKSWLAPVFLTILSAGVIGTVLGIFIINLFTGIENEQTGEDPSPSTAVTAQETDNQVKAEQQLPTLAAYVLQAGLFEEKANAEEWQQSYMSAGEPAFIWERDGQYFLLIGIFHTEEQAKQRAVELQGEGFDVFVKEWQTNEKELNLTEGASEWVNQLGQVWEEALTAKENTPLVNHLEQAPKEDELGNLVEILGEQTENIEVYLLQVMQAYDNL
ncbi:MULTISPECIES: SPOR domain-containing protein [unclassified Oceanobacillus]|uniref:SPOR domain-containing protein n=1 Tax=unclassified Oceanobacillus TaxID=2630292 RepID=UPI0012EB271D|nr:SPOR domain-containing protein [Oceanobacillus sp. AG]